MEDEPVNVETACRLCLLSEEGVEMLNIDKKMLESIRHCGIKMVKGPELPNRICMNCYSILQFIRKFQKMCENSDTYLSTLNPPIQYVRKKDITPNPELNTGNNEEIAIDYENELSNEVVIRDSSPQEKSVPEERLEVETEDAEYVFEENENELQEHEQEEPKIDMETELELVKEETEGRTDEETEELWIEGCEEDYEEQTVFILDNESNVDDQDSGSVKLDKRRRYLKPEKAVAIEDSEKNVATDERHFCEICGNSYKKLGSLESHRRRHLNSRPYECEICSVSFDYNFKLERHMRKHTGDRPYQCEYCNRRFVDRSTMSRHQKIHRNERAYTCDTCGKSFTYYSVLKTHIMSHTGEKPYTCDICGKGFHRASDLRNHLETLLHRTDDRAAVLLKKLRRRNE